MNHKIIEGELQGANQKLAIVVGRFNSFIGDALLGGALGWAIAHNQSTGRQIAAAAGGAALLPPGGAAATLRCTFLGKRAPRGDVMACCMAALVPLACCCCCCLKGWLSCCDVIGCGIVTCDVADLLGVTCADILGGGPLMRRRTLSSDMRICS